MTSATKKCLIGGSLFLHEVATWTLAIFTCLYPWYSIFMFIGVIYYISMPAYCFPQYYRLTTIHIILSIFYSIIIVPCALIQLSKHPNIPQYTLTSSILSCLMILIFTFVFAKKQHVYPFYRSRYGNIPELGSRV